MSESKTEEIIASIWAVCAVLCFAFDFTVWGWIFSIKAAFDTGTSIAYAIREIIKEKEQS